MRNPRLAITFKPEQYQVISRLSELTDQPMSRVISDLLSVAFPSLESLVDVLEGVNKLDSEVKSKFAKSLDDALESNRQAMQMLAELLDAEKGNPPSSNTGVSSL